MAITAEGLSKRFLLHPERRTGLKERFIRGKAPKPQEFWAVRDASFSVPKGTTFGLIGPNGSGKSTTLKVLAGIYRPTTGSVTIDGRVSALLEVGAGFHGELTGRENVRLNGAILGLSGRQVSQAMDSIIDFADIGDFIDEPVKVYSSGMFVRLGFAVAISLDPEILIIDEVIAVGDEAFQRRCFDYIHHLRQRGSSIVLVSHSLGIIRDMCDEAVWLGQGVIQRRGPAREVADAYADAVNEQETQTQAASTEPDLNSVSRVGSGEVQVMSIEMLDERGELCSVLVSGQACTFRMRYRARESLGGLTFGLGFVHESGANVSGPDSGRVGPFSVESGEGYVDFRVAELLLHAGSYHVDTTITDRGHTYDRTKGQFVVRVRGHGKDEMGLTRMPGEWKAPISHTSIGDPGGSGVVAGAS